MDSKFRLELYFNHEAAGGSIIVHQKEGNFAAIPLYAKTTDVMMGEVKFQPPPSCKELGSGDLALELVGQAESRQGKSVFPFFSSQMILNNNLNLSQENTIAFKIKSFEKKCASYIGKNFRIRYFLRATVSQQKTKLAEVEHDFAINLINVINPQPFPFETQVGIQGCLDVGIQLRQLDFYSDEVIIGKVTVNLVLLDVKRIFIDFIRSETYRLGSELKTETDTIVSLNLKEGQPQKGEIFPIKLDLTRLAVGPSFTILDGNFKATYILKVVLVANENRMYFRRIPIGIRNRV